jgi:hypothetical protein
MTIKLENECDGAGPHSGPNETKLYRLGGNGNLILCLACWKRENAYNASRGFKTQPWDGAALYRCW